MSWFWRGTQSAIFYYASCVPCHELAYRRRRRKGAARSRAEKEMDQGPYPHPSPFNTNVYWQEEIAMGPGPPRKNGRARREQERKRWGDRGTDDKENRRGLTTGNSTDTGVSSADTVVTQNSLQGVVELEHDRRSGDGWNRRRYQREDELLWGIDDAIEDDAEGVNSYTNVRNPSVNDLHPPVVSTISSNRSETRWMLQPPPCARIMEGKMQANRSRSASGGSNGSSKRGDPGLGRQLGEKMVEEKRRKGHTSQTGSPGMSRVATEESQMSSNTTTRGQGHDRDQDSARLPKTPQTSTEGSKPRTQARSLDVPLDDLQNSGHLPPPASMTKAAAKHLFPSQRPRLETVVSSTAISPVKSSPGSAHPPSFPLRPPLPPSAASTPSLRALQELTPPSAALNSRRPFSSPPSSASKIDLPAPDTEEDESLEIPEVETLWPGEFTFEAGEVENRRHHRWSMDI
ncbi:MAG: hypothetical protein Q9178_002652 [Gyalolechia marmorata]